MDLTLKIKLAPTNEQFEQLKVTMERFNESCNYIAQIAFEKRIANKYKLQPFVYKDVRQSYGLSAQMTIRAIAKVVEAYKRDKKIKPEFKPHGAITYDERILSWKGIDRVSILTTSGRIKVPIVMDSYHRSRLDRIRGQADLIFIDNTFYLCAVVDVPEPKMIEPVETLGIDLGIVNLAVDSDGKEYSGAKVEEVRAKTADLKAGLQGKGTKSAKKHLKRVKGKEERFRRDTNHVISKKIVQTAKDTGRRIAVEDLKGIRDQTTVRRSQRNRHSSWGFNQLRSFIEYKAVLAGVPVIPVEPRGTSHTCPDCGCLDKKNRPNRDTFRCVQCGLVGHADHIAAINIARRANVNTPIVSMDVQRHNVESPLGTSPLPLGVGC